jgi:hypothetical protein
MGIEPTSSAWKAEVLPLNYTRLEFHVPDGLRATARSANPGAQQIRQSDIKLSEFSNRFALPSLRTAGAAAPDLCVLLFAALQKCAG